jgi:serine/threonine protein kinase
VSPEVLNDEPSSVEADFWALGVILFKLLTGRSPFKGDSEDETFQNILSLNYFFKVTDKINEHAKDLIAKLLTLDPKQRIGVNDFESIKEHPYFNGI